MAPVFGFTGMAVCAAFIPIPGVFNGLFNMGDLLVIFYLLPASAMAIMLGGSASSSPYGAVGFSREMMLMLAYETPLLMILLSVAMLTGKTLGGGATTGRGIFAAQDHWPCSSRWVRSDWQKFTIKRNSTRQ